VPAWAGPERAIRVNTAANAVNARRIFFTDYPKGIVGFLKIFYRTNSSNRKHSPQHSLRSRDRLRAGPAAISP